LTPLVAAPGVTHPSDATMLAACKHQLASYTDRHEDLVMAASCPHASVSSVCSILSILCVLNGVALAVSHAGLKTDEGVTSRRCLGAPRALVEYRVEMRDLTIS